LPAKLRAVYEEATRDPGILSLRADVALLTSVIEQKLEGMDGGASIGLTIAAWSQLEAAVRSRETAAIVQATDAMRRAVSGLGEQQVIMRDVFKTMALKGKLSVAESKRQVAAATMLDAASAWALVSALGELVKTHVADPVARRAISEGLVRITHRGALPGNQ
jgi:hypothetical protein